MRRKVIANKNLPTRLPVIGTLVCYLLLEHWGWPGVMTGIVATVMAIGWLVAIVELVVTDEVDVLK